jgi:hypothetical protein
MKGKKLPESAYDVKKVSIYQFDKQGKFLSKYHSIQEASDRTSIDRASISNSASGKRKSAGGFLWSFDSSITITEKKVIQQFDLNGNLINTYNTLEEVLKRLNITSRTAIKNACKGKQYQAYGFQWRKHYYVSKIEKIPVKKIQGKPIYQIDLVTDEIINQFPNTTYAAKALNISKTSINNCAIGKYVQGGGYKWKYK